MRVPKYLEERFERLEPASDLIDDCKYLLYFKEGWGIDDGYELCGCYPVRSKAEALKYLRESISQEQLDKVLEEWQQKFTSKDSN